MVNNATVDRESTVRDQNLNVRRDGIAYCALASNTSQYEELWLLLCPIANAHLPYQRLKKPSIIS